jgi:hypothetical protein
MTFNHQKTEPVFEGIRKDSFIEVGRVQNGRGKEKDKN